MASTEKTAIFPGMFDPITNGHVDIIKRGSKLFDRVVVAIGHNPAKQLLFTQDERAAMIRDILAHEENVTVDTFTGLTVDYARRINATAILRGLRNLTDLNFEFQLALTNRAVADIETVFIMTGEPYALTSSTLIKQIASAGDVARLHRLVPPIVLEGLKRKKAELGDGMHHHDGLKE